jgi:hypothetical protein
MMKYPSFPAKSRKLVMDLETFEAHLLACVGSDGPSRRASHDVIYSLWSTDLLPYLTLLTAAIFDETHPSVQSSSITILFAQVRSIHCFLDLEIITHFWFPTFFPSLPVLLGMPQIPPNFKEMAIDIFSWVSTKNRVLQWHIRV